MKLYIIISPGGGNLRIGADSIYHAIQLALERENYKYNRHDYFKLNDDQVKKYEAKVKRYK